MLSTIIFFIGTLVGALSAITRPTKGTLLGVMSDSGVWRDRVIWLVDIESSSVVLILELVDPDP